MNKKIVSLVFAALVIFYFASIIINQDSLSKELDNPQYQNYISEYESIVSKKVQDIISEEDQSNFEMNYRAKNSTGTVSNFEGPQVHLKGIKFHNEYLTSEDERLKHIDAVYAHFVPGHAY